MKILVIQGIELMIQGIELMIQSIELMIQSIELMIQSIGLKHPNDDFSASKVMVSIQFVGADLRICPQLAFVPLQANTQIRLFELQWTNCDIVNVRD